MLINIYFKIPLTITGASCYNIRNSALCALTHSVLFSTQTQVTSPRHIND